MNEDMTDKTLREEIADFLTGRFIGNPADLPWDECYTEAKYILSLIISHLKPLDNGEIIAEYQGWTDINPADEYQMKGLRGISQATIQKNIERLGE